jgi:hypothetical protein
VKRRGLFGILAGLVTARPGLAAQTRVPTSVLTGPSGPGGVLVVTAQGGVAMATLGSGIELAANGNSFVLRALSLQRATNVKPTRQADGSYLLTNPASAVTVYRNGVRQSPGDDYTYDPPTRAIVPVTGWPWLADDLVLCDCEF